MDNRIEPDSPDTISCKPLGRHLVQLREGTVDRTTPLAFYMSEGIYYVQNSDELRTDEGKIRAQNNSTVFNFFHVGQPGIRTPEV